MRPPSSSRETLVVQGCKEDKATGKTLRGFLQTLYRATNGIVWGFFQGVGWVSFFFFPLKTTFSYCSADPEQRWWGLLIWGSTSETALEISISSGAFKILRLFFSPDFSGSLLLFSPLFVTAFDRKSEAVIPVTAVANIQLYLHIQSNLWRIKSISEFLTACSTLSHVLTTPDFTGQILCRAVPFSKTALAP